MGHPAQFPRSLATGLLLPEQNREAVVAATVAQEGKPPLSLSHFTVAGNPPHPTMHPDVPQAHYTSVYRMPP